MLHDPITPSDAVELRAFFRNAGFTEAGVAERLGIPDIYAFTPSYAGRDPLPPTGNALDLCIRLFMDSEEVGADAVERWIPSGVADALTRWELLSVDGDFARSPVLLYPTAGLYIVSDQPGVGLREDGRQAADAVYPAVTRGAKHFVSAIPRSPAERVLELCSGTGIGALIAARTAGEAWAVDITERSTRFARFNAALNGLENVTALEGDLYGPVEGRTFDRILAHPPYVQSIETKAIFRDGGIDGERVTRGVVEGLPGHLEPGGRLFCHCTLADRDGETMEDRVRRWLGEAAREFDVFLFTLGTLDPYRALFQEALRGRVTQDEAQERDRLYREMGLRELVYATLLVQRTETSRPVVNVRRLRDDETPGEAFEWLAGWETASSAPGGLDALGAATPTAAPWLRSIVRRGLRDGRWAVEETVLETDRPFPNRIPCAPWLVDFVASCDGERTVDGHFEALRRDGLLRADTSEEAFRGLVASLVSAGVLLHPDHPLPPAITS